MAEVAPMEIVIAATTARMKTMADIADPIMEMFLNVTAIMIATGSIVQAMKCLHGLAIRKQNRDAIATGN
jgi:hypothetical protein